MDVDVADCQCNWMIRRELPIPARHRATAWKYEGGSAIHEGLHLPIIQARCGKDKRNETLPASIRRRANARRPPLTSHQRSTIAGAAWMAVSKSWTDAT